MPDKINFTGDIRKLHFISFIQFLKNKVNHLMYLEDFKMHIIIIKCKLLKQEALLRFTSAESDFGSFRNLKRNF